MTERSHPSQAVKGRLGDAGVLSKKALEQRAEALQTKNKAAKEALRGDKEKQRTVLLLSFVLSPSLSFEGNIK